MIDVDGLLTTSGGINYRKIKFDNFNWFDSAALMIVDIIETD